MYFTLSPHGNMTKLVRRGMIGPQEYGMIDDLTLRHKGNQLYHIHDDIPYISYQQTMDFKDNNKTDVQEYFYNRNGAMIKDLNKGIEEITYNVLNLPQKIRINNTSAQGTNEYTYTATGVKLRMKSHSDMNRMGMPVHGTSMALSDNTADKVIDYIGNKIYEENNLKMILLDNGYYDNQENKYYFYVRDHLGNNRIVVDAGGAQVGTVPNFYRSTRLMGPKILQKWDCP